MSKVKTSKIRIFSYQTNIEWYDIKTKYKQLIRKIAYSNLVQELISWLIFSYIFLVYKTSKKIYINQEVLLEAAKNNQAAICCSWHNRVMMTPFAVRNAQKLYPQTKYMTLASKHGDGKFVGKVMEKFDSISILGSTQDNRKEGRGIDIASFRKIFSGLKKGYILGITPDGPRGPNQEINGEVVNIAKKSQAQLIPFSYSCSKFIILKTWDNFKIPLPFSTLSFCFGEAFRINEKIDDKEAEEIKILLKKSLDDVQNLSDKIVKNS